MRLSVTLLLKCHAINDDIGDHVMSARALCLFALPSFCFSHFFPSFARRWPRWKKASACWICLPSMQVEHIHFIFSLFVHFSLAFCRQKPLGFYASVGGWDRGLTTRPVSGRPRFGSWSWSYTFRLVSNTVVHDKTLCDKIMLKGLKCNKHLCFFVQ